jgi:uncharacterized protein
MKHLLVRPDAARALLVLAHGAGAGMRHPFLETIARVLGKHGIASFRYEFAYMEAHKNRPDPPAVAMARVRAAVGEAAAAAPDLPLLAGGKSFGGRMTSNAQAVEPLAGVRGLVFLGFPLHPPSAPSIARGDHLDEVQVPMLFLRGTRDTFSDRDELVKVLDRLGAKATLYEIEGGDHSFNVPKSSGKSKDDVMEDLSTAISRFADNLISHDRARRH